MSEELPVLWLDSVGRNQKGPVVPLSLSENALPPAEGLGFARQPSSAPEESG